jgi:hypothetical protein
VISGFAEAADGSAAADSEVADSEVVGVGFEGVGSEGVASGAAPSASVVRALRDRPNAFRRRVRMPMCATLRVR